jgi:hypothetical protein
MSDTTQPSDHARELLQGAYDVHIHIAPDVVPRIVDDVTLAKRFLDLGMAGFTLKSHSGSTAERASSVSAATGADVKGAIALNRAVGGLNPLAVEVAGREGARTVWLPTVDSVNEAQHLNELPEGAKLPVWVKLQQDLRDRGIKIDPVPVTDESGELLPELLEVLDTVAQHQMVLATGHLSRDEIFKVVDAAVGKGIKDVVVTHPEFPSQNIGATDQRELVAMGALLERCFTTPHTGKVDWQVWIDNIKATGAENSILSTDLGQTFNPPVEDGLALMVDRLLAAGFDEDEVKVMAVTNTRRLAGADA